MTRKDYVAIAAALVTVRPDLGDDSPGGLVAEKVWTNCCRVIGDVFAADNPNFDRMRWIHALLAKS